MASIPKAVRAYMAHIGAKGGRKGKGKPKKQSKKRAKRGKAKWTTKTGN